MSIIFSEKEQTFYLETPGSSYIIKLYKEKLLFHLYWGKRIARQNLDYLMHLPYRRQYLEELSPEDANFSLEYYLQEYPDAGRLNFRPAAFQIVQEDGSRTTGFTYVSHQICPGKPKLAGLPAVYTESPEEADTLEITMYDERLSLAMILSYSVYNNHDVITRNVCFINKGTENVDIRRAYSCCLEFREHDFTMLHLHGAAHREFHIAKEKLLEGGYYIESARGTSSHVHNPFLALLREGTTEDSGEVYGINLVYSGNFRADAYVDQYGQLRVNMGINPFDFSWQLCPGEVFQTPEAVCVYSDGGLNKMSSAFHHLYRERLCRGRYRDQVRPVLINNWEATYFDFNEEKLLAIAGPAKEIGVELFVLDDGWFGKRNNDDAALGDWFVNREKLPNGLDGLAEKVHDLGMQFGLWIEPEMICADSELYREHPDWCMHVPGRKRTESRNQLVLDFSRKEICDYILDKLCIILDSGRIGYIKWDMNRHYSEVYSVGLPKERQMETAHRNVLGLYYMMETLVTRYPDILFEGCASGGGRFDPGILYYMPQIWLSDDTDAAERMKIQHGASLVYPPIAITAHISAVPNHQIGRITSLKTRAYTAMMMNLGFELDVTKMSEAELKASAEMIEMYKEIRTLVQFGDFYRGKSPFDGNYVSWTCVSPDQREAVLYYSRILGRPEEAYQVVKVSGLNPEYEYICAETQQVFSGSVLMEIGIPVSAVRRDFECEIYYLHTI